MNITNMEGIWPRDGSFGSTVRAGNDKVVLLEVEQFDRQGEHRQVKSISLVEKRKSLDETGNDPLLFDIRNLASWKMKERIDRGIRIYLGKDLQDLFPTSPTGQPIMDKRYFGTVH
jgi:hypothetical protein